MKLKTLTIGLAIVAFGFSCKKDECKECHYDGPSGEVDLGEKCGDDITNLEANGHTENGTTYTVHCGEGH